MELTAGEARYLLALRDLDQEGEPPSQAVLARALEVAQPTALEMVRRLRALGLIEDDSLALTGNGTSAALVLASRRRAALVLAHDVLGMDGAQAAEEAGRLAANVSPVLGRRLIAWRAGQRRQERRGAEAVSPDPAPPGTTA
jgi:Mn-dependent DtxR family transcriptional regulator